jgi:glutathione synthase/RimK-type ligase-like ATP-grasp enzyme
MIKFDIVVLTDKRFVNPAKDDVYMQNVVTEDRMVVESLEKKGLKVYRTHWDDPEMDWPLTRNILFRTTWDYHHRFDEFSNWLKDVDSKTNMINPYELVLWNQDKHYLKELAQQGINIPATIFMEKGENYSLVDLFERTNFTEAIIKPTISAAARETYRIKREDAQENEILLKNNLQLESMIFQEFQEQIAIKGELSIVVFDGKFSHAVLKKTKPGDFRVQDYWGGSLHDYKISQMEIDLAEHIVSLINLKPVYARVDLMWNNQNELCLAELEIIEPELWFRRFPESADRFADAIFKHLY